MNVSGEARKQKTGRRKESEATNDEERQEGDDERSLSLSTG